jgi:heme/copper-type cytochrome/quinol oxidase subunit 1
MGITYYLLPRLGFRQPSIWLARIQPAVYGIGQLLHILGLAWSGGYGVQRKTVGAAQGLETIQEKLGMWLMSLGGAIAIIGGSLFLVVAIMSIWPRKKSTTET